MQKQKQKRPKKPKVPIRKSMRVHQKKKKSASILEKVIPMIGALEIRVRAAQDARMNRYDIESAMDLKLGKTTGKVVESMIAAFMRTTSPELLQDCLLHLESHSKLLRYHSTINTVRELVDDRKSWIRPFQSWHPKSHSPHRQLSELLRHCYALYPVPRFMDDAFSNFAWRLGGEKKEWFKHVGAGYNMRTAKSLPIPLTKKMAHYFLMAPHHYSIEEAFVSAQVRAVGGGRQLVSRLCKIFVYDFEYWSRFVKDNAFWLNVIRFLKANPKLDGSHVELIVDYIYDQKYENARDPIDFSMKGRTADALLRAAETWKQDLDGIREKQWPPSGIGGFLFQEVDVDTCSLKSGSIRELLSTKELVAEGHLMRHCLKENFSYAKSCYERKLSIWTMEMREETSKCDKILTIAVSLKENPKIIEVASHNRCLTAEELFLVEAWADQEGIIFDKKVLSLNR